MYRAKHCACVAMENEGGRSVRSSSPLFALVTQFLVTSQWSGFLTRESKKMRES